MGRECGKAEKGDKSGLGAESWEWKRDRRWSGCRRGGVQIGEAKRQPQMQPRPSPRVPTKQPRPTHPNSAEQRRNEEPSRQALRRIAFLPALSLSLVLYCCHLFRLIAALHSSATTSALRLLSHFLHHPTRPSKPTLASLQPTQYSLLKRAQRSRFLEEGTAQ